MSPAPEAREDVPQPQQVPQPQPVPQQVPQAQQVPQPAAPSPANQPQPAPQSEERFTLHHSYIWLGSVQILIPVLIAIMVSLGGSFISVIAEGVPTGEDAEVALALGITAVVIILVMVFIIVGRIIGYKFTWYTFSPREFNFYKGIIFKSRTHIPYQRVQSIDQKATFIQRLIGVCSVTIETAGGSSNKATVIPFVDKSAAEYIRREIFVRKQLMEQGYTPEQARDYLAWQTYQQQVAEYNQWQIAHGGVPIQPVPMPAYVMMPGATQAGATQAGATQAGAATPSPTFTPGVVPGVVPDAAPTRGNVLDAPAQFANDMRGIFGGAEINTGQVTYSYGLTNSQLFLSALCGKSSTLMAIVTVIITAVSFLGTLADFNFLTEDDIIAAAVSAVHSELLPALVIPMIVSVLGFVLIVWVVLLVGTCIQYAGFNARRRGSRVEVEYGLFSHTFKGIDIDRIQTVEITQTLFQRLMGYCTLAYGRLGSISSESSSSDNAALSAMIVHPFIKKSKVDEIIQGLTPEFADYARPDTRVAPVARRRALIREGVVQGFGFWALIILTIALIQIDLLALDLTNPDHVDFLVAQALYMGALGYLYALAFIIMIVELIGALLWYKSAAFGLDYKYLTITSGHYTTRTVSMMRNKIQYGGTKTNPLQRHAKTVTLEARSAAGTGGTTERLIDITEADAKRWMEWITPGGNHVYTEVPLEDTAAELGAGELEAVTPEAVVGELEAVAPGAVAGEPEVPTAALVDDNTPDADSHAEMR